MTQAQKKFFDLFPAGEVVRRQEIIEKYPKQWNEVAFGALVRAELIEVCGVDDDAQYLRRRTTEEIREIYFNK